MGQLVSILPLGVLVCLRMIVFLYLVNVDLSFVGHCKRFQSPMNMFSSELSRFCNLISGLEKVLHWGHLGHKERRSLVFGQGT